MSTSESSPVSATTKRSRSDSAGVSLLQRYLQNPFSIAWSKLAELFQPVQAAKEPEVLENSEPESHQAEFIQKHYSYPHFTDRIDPSVYYTVLISPRTLKR
jgi:hypothetical protein